MGDDPRSAIAKLLDDLRPRTLLLLSPDPHGEWRRWCEQHCAAAITALADEPLRALETLGHYDIALVIGLMEQLDKTTGTQLIGRLRNVHTEHLFALVGADSRWPATEWFSLALQRADQFQIGGHLLTLYGYDLANYNRVRSWNNPKYWANPENWGKYWW
jgi:hypothetical protein